MPPPATIETAGLIVTRLSPSEKPRPFWSLAMFAHNESGRIGPALERIVAAAGGVDVEVWVLANGCSDSTCDEVRACAHLVPNLWLAEIPRGDKANAWNVYVHELVSRTRVPEIDTYFFTDGDVTLEPYALFRLAAALEQVPDAQAAGAMPATGRDKRDWRQRMALNGNLAGNLYALRGRFVDAVRERQIRLPLGIVFEDALVSWLAKTQPARRQSVSGQTPCIFCPTAEFSFRSMSPWRSGDYLRYLHRKWRYAHGHLQIEMLVNVLMRNGLTAMPADVHELYRTGPLPSRLRWVGVDTLLRFAAVMNIRRFRTKS